MKELKSVSKKELKEYIKEIDENLDREKEESKKIDSDFKEELKRIEERQERDKDKPIMDSLCCGIYNHGRDTRWDNLPDILLGAFFLGILLFAGLVISGLIPEKETTHKGYTPDRGFIVEEEEIEEYKQAIRRNPDDAELHWSLGFDYCLLEQWNKAIETFKQIIRINPNDTAAYNLLSVAYCKLGRYQEAIVILKQAIHIKPDFCLCSSLGEVYDKLGRYQEAIGAYKQAIRIGPDYTEWLHDLHAIAGRIGKTHYNLGVAYLLSGDKNSALRQYRILKGPDKDLAEKLYTLIKEKEVIISQ